MGYMSHDAIIVTSWNADALSLAATEAERLGCRIIGPSAPMINDYRTFVVVPDGSKEGWEESNAGDLRRAELIEYLRSREYEDGSTCLHWVAVRYSSDDGEAEIIDDAWRDVPVSEE